MHTPPASPASRERALVFGGGGSAGNAWSIGVLAGLADAGLDVTDADLIIGTSAGSTTAAQVTSANPADLLAATLDAPRAPASAPNHDSAHVARAVADRVAEQMRRTAAIIAAAENMADMRRRAGAAAIELDPEGERTPAWRATVAARLPSREWPRQTLQITAVDALTGEPVVFDRHSGVELVDAIAASCSSGFAYRIGDGRYIDGGYRANADNADLAAGYARVLVLSPFGGRTRTPVGWGMHLDVHVEQLRAADSRVETVYPPDDVEHMFGPNAMDPSFRAPAARAGYDQGRSLAGRLTAFWR